MTTRSPGSFCVLDDCGQCNWEPLLFCITRGMGYRGGDILVVCQDLVSLFARILQNTFLSTFNSEIMVLHTGWTPHCNLSTDRYFSILLNPNESPKMSHHPVTVVVNFVQYVICLWYRSFPSNQGHWPPAIWALSCQGKCWPAKHSFQVEFFLSPWVTVHFAEILFHHLIWGLQHLSSFGSQEVWH